ncbi:hypothetical protein HY640_01285 [Candidatus Woesearchaeota archaeon]|nr:hypothetical protein [Candidatus Woesearchaeota archaeon]
MICELVSRLYQRFMRASGFQKARQTLTAYDASDEQRIATTMFINPAQPENDTGINALFVDSDERFAAQLGRWLMEHGINVLYAKDPKSAQSALRSLYLDVILVSDVFGKRGLVDFLRAANSGCVQNPVILLKTYGGVTIDDLVNQGVPVNSWGSFFKSEINDPDSGTMEEVLAAVTNLSMGKAVMDRSLVSGFAYDFKTWRKDPRQRGVESYMGLPVLPGQSDNLAPSQYSLAKAADYIALRMRPRALGNPPYQRLTIISESAAQGIVSLTEPMGSYGSARRPNFSETHLKVTSVEDLRALLGYLEIRFPTIRLPAPIAVCKLGEEQRTVMGVDVVLVVYRSLVAANLAHVSSTLYNAGKFPEHAQISDASLLRTIDMLSEWYKYTGSLSDLQLQEIEGIKGIERLYLRSARNALASLRTLSPEHSDHTYNYTVKAYEGVISLLSAQDQNHFGRIIDAQPQNIGAMWGMTFPDADMIISRLMNGYPRVIPKKPTAIAVFDPQPRTGLKLEDALHLIWAEELHLPAEKRIEFVERAITALFSDREDLLPSAPLVAALMGTYKGMRKAYIVAEFVRNVTRSFHTGKIPLNDYKNFLETYSRSFLNWQRLSLDFASAALYVAQEFKPGDFDYNMGLFRAHLVTGPGPVAVPRVPSKTSTGYGYYDRETIGLLSNAVVAAQYIAQLNNPAEIAKEKARL